MQPAVSAAAKHTIPRKIEFLIRESYDWFSKSSLRQDSYKNLYAAINEGKEPLKIVQACQTRWLSVEVAVSRIVDQWLELKTHFQVARNSERCYMAEELYGLYKGDQNFLFLSFLRQILKNVQSVNKLFEAENVDPTRLYGELKSLIIQLAEMVKVPHIKIDLLEDINGFEKLKANVYKNCYLGYAFEHNMRILKDKAEIKQDEEQVMRERAIDFYPEVGGAINVESS